jgi:hypothetical protein
MSSIGVLPGTHDPTRPVWARLIFSLDGLLQWRGGVFEYSRRSDCIFRAELGRLSSDILLSDGTAGRLGDRVVEIHFWNEQIPVKPSAGSSLGWGCRFNRSIANSLGELAQFLASKPEFSDINIVRASINLDLLVPIAARHGFEAARDEADPSAWDSLHQFGENILHWLLALACNPGGGRPHTFWRRRRMRYLSRRVLDRRHDVRRRSDQAPVRRDEPQAAPQAIYQPAHI